MPDLTISSAATLTGSTVATNDLIPVLDISAASGSKGSKITVAELFTGRGITGGTHTAIADLGLRSTGAAFDLKLGSAEALTAERTLNFNVGDANRTLTIPGDGTVALLGTINVFTAPQEYSSAAPALATGNRFRLNFDGSNGYFEIASQYSTLQISCGGGSALLSSSTGGAVNIGNSLGITSDRYGNNQVLLVSRATAHLGIGAASATPVAQTLGGAQGVGANISGGTLNIGTRGTGTGTGGVINFQTHAAGSSGSTLQTLVTMMSISSSGIDLSGLSTTPAVAAASTETVGIMVGGVLKQFMIA